MEHLRSNGSITWKDIITTIPEIIEDEKKRVPGKKIVIPDATIMITHRLTRINLRINRRLRELRRKGKIEKKSMKFARGSFNVLRDGKWKAVSNMKALNTLFPSENGTEVQDRMEDEPIPAAVS
jgi:hypothetical protein